MLSYVEYNVVVGCPDMIVDPSSDDVMVAYTSAEEVGQVRILKEHMKCEATDHITQESSKRVKIRHCKLNAIIKVRASSGAVLAVCKKHQNVGKKVGAL